MTRSPRRAAIGAAATVAAVVAAPGTAAAAPLVPQVTAEVDGNNVALTVSNPYPAVPDGEFAGWCYATVQSWPVPVTEWRPSSPPGTDANPPTDEAIADAGFAVAGRSVTVDITLPRGLYLATGTCLSPEGTSTTPWPTIILVWPPAG